MASRVNYGGLVIAGLGFFLTRFTVTLAIYDDPIRFYLAGVVPLMLGLGLAAFGVALAVADVEPPVVRTTTRWCLVGFVTMLGLVVLTLLGSETGMPTVETMRSQTYLSNFLIGGSVGGTLTGLYASRARRHRGELQQQANRLAILNRLLRHEILNAVAVIRGYAGSIDDANLDAGSVIERRALGIQQTIEEVKHLTRRAGFDDAVPTDLGRALNESIEAISERYPDADVEATIPTDLMVRGNDHLSRVFTQLLENAIVHGRDEAPRLTVSRTGMRVRITVHDDGPGLPENQRQLLETGDIEQFDDPSTGFGLNVVRLLVESYDGQIETTVDERGSAVTVVLPRAATADAAFQTSPTTGVRPAIPHLVLTLGASMVAGVVYGVASRLLGGSIAGIGVFYGAPDPVVGWITHQFHSAVFGFAFVGLVMLAPEERRDALRTHVAIGVGWAIALWVVAAGIVAPVWLRLLGIPARLPYLQPTLLVTHLVWGVTLALLIAWGSTAVTPRIQRVVERLQQQG